MLKMGLAFFILVFCNSVLAINCQDIFRSKLDVYGAEVPFIAPNEPHPVHAKPILDQAPAGVLLSVGSERVLFNYLLKKSETPFVMAVDQDPGILQFHRINEILFRITPYGDVETYRKLRIKPESVDWLRFAATARKAQLISETEFVFFTDMRTYQWWTEKVGTNPNFYYLNQKPVPQKANPFKDVNYLYDAALLSRLQDLAYRGGYRYKQVDLSSLASVNSLIELLKQLQQPVSVIDISNAWQKEGLNQYLGPDKLASLLFSLQPSFQKNTFLIMTDLISATDFRLWSYVGFKMLKPNPEAHRVLSFWQLKTKMMDQKMKSLRKKFFSQFLQDIESSWHTKPWHNITVVNWQE